MYYKKIVILSLFSIFTLVGCNSSDTPSQENKGKPNIINPDDSGTSDPDDSGTSDPDDSGTSDPDDEITSISFDKEMTKTLINAPLYIGNRKLYASKNGKILVVADRGDSVTVNVFKKQKNGWSLVKQITSNDRVFATKISINNDGSYLFISSPYEDSNYIENSGAVHIYKNNGNTFHLEQTLTNNSIKRNGNFGSDISISDDGNILAISADQNKRSNDKHGGVFLYEKNLNSNTWVFSNEINGNSEDAYFGSHIELNGDGNKLLVSNLSTHLYLIDSPTNKSKPLQTIQVESVNDIAFNRDGTVFAYSNYEGDDESVTIYTLEDNIYKKHPLSNPISNNFFNTYPGYQFARQIELSEDGTTLLASASNDHYEPPTSTLVKDFNLESLLTKIEECPPRYGSSSKISTGAVIAYEMDKEDNSWKVKQYIKPNLSEIRKYNKKDICNQNFVDGYKGERKVIEQISFTILNDSIIASTINGNLFEYKNLASK